MDIPDIEYTIVLPEFKSSYLTVLQNNSDLGVYTTFDEDTDLCVVDNCANVHIWNNRKGFIPESYIKFNEAASTKVSAVNGKSNMLAGCGDVPVSWTNDKEKKYNIILKNVLHFPKSPVNILSIVSLAEPFGDDLDTWMLSRHKHPILTRAHGQYSKTIVYGKSRLTEMLINTAKNYIAAFHALAGASKTSDCHLVFLKAFATDCSILYSNEKNQYQAFDTKSLPVLEVTPCPDEKTVWHQALLMMTTMVDCCIMRLLSSKLTVQLDI